MGPLSQLTASVCTFENTRQLRFILLLFCQQLGSDRKAHHSPAVHVLVQKGEICLLPCPKLKMRPYNISVGNHVGGIYISQSDSLISVKLQK